MRPDLTIQQQQSASRPMRIQSHRFLFALLSALVAGTSLLTIAGCDTSEDDSLLNPPVPDSAGVRVVNLVPDAKVTVRLSDRPAATGVNSYTISDYSTFYFQEPFSVFIESDGGDVDTVAPVRMQLFADADIRQTYFIVGTAESKALLTLESNKEQITDLTNEESGALYFVNGISDTTMLIKRGCRSGDTLFRSQNGNPSGGFQELPQGSYSFYLFTADGQSEDATALVEITPGSIQYLVAADLGSGPQLFLIDGSGDETGSLPPVQPETRTESQVEVLNGLDGTSLSVSFQGDASPLVSDIPSRGLSAAQSVAVCRDPGGDTLLLVTGTDDTARAQVSTPVGGKTLATVYNDGTQVRLLLLDRSPMAAEEGRVYIRGVNLSPASKSAAVVVGAGAPEGVPTDYRPFGALRVGGVSPYVSMPEGSYPLVLRQNSTGKFFDGGLQNLSSGFYTLFILEENGTPRLFLLRDDVTGVSPQPLEAPGQTAQFFSMIPDRLVNFEATSGGISVVVDSVAYSYVYPTILPADMVSIQVAGIGGTTIDLSGAGHTIGATGSDGNLDVLAFPLPTDPLSPMEAGIRFLHAVPGGGGLEVRSDSAKGELLTGISYGTPSPTIRREPRRYSFSITDAGSGEEVARIQGVELSGDRHYLLIVGPKGSTSSSNLRYGTLWMQE